MTTGNTTVEDKGKGPKNGSGVGQGGASGGSSKEDLKKGAGASNGRSTPTIVDNSGGDDSSSSKRNVHEEMAAVLASSRLRSTMIKLNMILLVIATSLLVYSLASMWSSGIILNAAVWASMACVDVYALIAAVLILTASLAFMLHHGKRPSVSSQVPAWVCCVNTSEEQQGFATVSARNVSLLSGPEKSPVDAMGCITIALTLATAFMVGYYGLDIFSAIAMGASGFLDAPIQHQAFVCILGLLLLAAFVCAFRGGFLSKGFDQSCTPTERLLRGGDTIVLQRQIGSDSAQASSGEESGSSCWLAQVEVCGGPLTWTELSSKGLQQCSTKTGGGSGGVGGACAAAM